MVYDLLMRFGLQAFISKDDEENAASDIKALLDVELSARKRPLRRSMTREELGNTQGGNSVVVILTRLLDDPNVDIRTKVIEGMCKLLMIRSVVSGKLLSR